MAPDLTGEITSKLDHRHEQCLLLHKEGNDRGGKRTNVQGRLLDGTETTKWGGLLTGTRWIIYFYGETWPAHGDF